MAGKATAEHDFDATCKAHDAAYAASTDAKSRNKADDEFVEANRGKGYLRTAAAAAVHGNRYFRNGGISLRGSAQQTREGQPTCKKESFRDQLKSKKLFNTNNTMTNKSKRNNGGNRSRGAAAVAYSKAVGISAPTIGTRSNGRTVISHREYVCPLVGDTGLSILGKNVNPGLSEVFPWLSTIAANYEKYKMVKLSFQYVTSSGTSTGGRVGLAFGYNPSEAIPLNKQEFFSIVPNREEAPWEDIILHVPCTGETKYVRFAGIDSGTVNTYDMGKVVTATGNNADSTSTLGDLFVEYEVELSRPHYGRIMSEELTIESPSSGVPMGTSFTVNRGIGLLQHGNEVTVTWQASGDFLVSYYGTGSGTAPSSADWNLVPIGNSDIQKSDIHLTIDNGATQFGLCYLALLKNVQVGDRMSLVTAAWGQSTGGMTVTRMSQH